MGKQTFSRHPYFRMPLLLFSFLKVPFPHLSKINTSDLLPGPSGRTGVILRTLKSQFVCVVPQSPHEKNAKVLFRPKRILAMVKANFSGIVHILPATLPLGHLRSACEGEFWVLRAFGKAAESQRLASTSQELSHQDHSVAPQDSKAVYYHFISSQTCLISWLGVVAFSLSSLLFLNGSVDLLSWSNLNPGSVLLSSEYTLQALSLIKNARFFPLEYVHAEGKLGLFVH